MKPTSMSYEIIKKDSGYMLHVQLKWYFVCTSKRYAFSSFSDLEKALQVLIPQAKDILDGVKKK